MAFTKLNTSTPSVAILMCSYNGSKFISEQLDSLEKQFFSNWRLIVSDDGSSDCTLKILREYQTRWPLGKIEIRNGPRKGFCQNFLSLACDPSIFADYYSFCDQDDVWLPTKLQVAMDYFGDQEDIQSPKAYCGRTIYVNQELKKQGYSPLFVFPRTFRNALVQSIAGGNTFVFNQKTKTLLEKVGPVNVPSHDWWLYLLVSGAGGEVYYDPIPQLLYRQHQDALVGGNTSFLATAVRIRMLLMNRFRDWNTQNIIALKQAGLLISPRNRENLEIFFRMRSAPFLKRLRLIEVSGIYRQTWPGTISLIAAALIKKI
jgi:glycosyltransferase involved in cell wall biosynthesis